MTSCHCVVFSGKIIEGYRFGDINSLHDLNDRIWICIMDGAFKHFFKFFNIVISFIMTRNWKCIRTKFLKSIELRRNIDSLQDVLFLKEEYSRPWASKLNHSPCVNPIRKNNFWCHIYPVELITFANIFLFVKYTWLVCLVLSSCIFIASVKSFNTANYES